MGARKVTLKKFIRKQTKFRDKPDPEVAEFLSKVKHKGRLLDIGCSSGQESKLAESLGFSVTAIDNDYDAIKKARETTKAEVIYSDFFTFAKKAGQYFDVILDNGFSNSMKQTEIYRYYVEISKLLNYRGLVFIKVYSTNDKYCEEHCPIRKWTPIDDMYCNFFDKDELLALVHKTGLKIENHKEVKQDDRTYHIVVARQLVKKW